MTDRVRVDEADRWAWVLAALSPVALVAFVSSPLWTRHFVPVWDAFDFYWPNFSFIADALRDGRFPLWNPYSNGGEPFFAEPQRGVLNPVVLVLGLLIRDVYKGFVLSWLIHWSWAGLGMVWLARRFGATPAGATLAGCAYGLSGFFISHAEHLSFVYVAAWLPWIIGLADDAVARRRSELALIAAAALGLCAVGGGYPMLVTFTGMTVFVWLALRYLASEREQRRAALRWLVGTLAIMGIVLLAMWSPLLVAFLDEGKVVSSRLTAVAPETSIYGSPVNLRSLISLFFPNATFSLWKSGVQLGADVSMTNSYMGFAAVPLAATWAWAGFRRERRWWLVAFAALMFLISLGGVGGVRWLLHYLLPPLRYMRFNAPFRIYWILAVCLAAGCGLRHLVQEEEARRTFLIAALAWLGITGIAGLALFVWMNICRVSVTAALPNLLLPALASGPTVVALAMRIRKRPTQGAVTLLVLVTAIDVAAAALVNHGTIWARNKHVREEVDAARRVVRPRDAPPVPRLQRLAYPFNKHMLLRVPVLENYTTFFQREINEVLFHSRFASVLCGHQRFWLAPGGEPLGGRERALSVLASSGAGDPIPAFVEAAEAIRPTSRVVPGTYGTVDTQSYLPEHIALRVEVPGNVPALLTGTERYTPAWKVTIDGRPATALVTNLFFRGVQVEPGIHEVVWRYEPARWWPLVALSAATLLAVTLGAAGVAWSKRRVPPSRSASARVERRGADMTGDGQLPHR